jgi:hypothetical protein
LTFLHCFFRLFLLTHLELSQQVHQLEENCSSLHHQVASAAERATERALSHREEVHAQRTYADRLAKELIKLKQFKAVERAYMPDDDDEESGGWAPSPRKGK